MDKVQVLTKFGLYMMSSEEREKKLKPNLKGLKMAILKDALA